MGNGTKFQKPPVPQRGIYRGAEVAINSGVKPDLETPRSPMDNQN